MGGAGLPGGNLASEPPPPPPAQDGNGNGDDEAPEEDPPPPDPPPEPPPAAPMVQAKGPWIKIALFNIISGRQARLEMALHAMDMMNIDLGFFLEAKLTDGIHTRRCNDYNVVATNAGCRLQQQGSGGAL